MKADRFPVIVHNRGKKMRKKTYTACSRMAAIFLAAVLMPFAWTFVIILLSAGFEKLFLFALDKAVGAVLGEEGTKC